MKLKIFNSENLKTIIYKLGEKMGFNITYKIPTKSELKTWWDKIWKKN